MIARFQEATTKTPPDKSSTASNQDFTHRFRFNRKVCMISCRWLFRSRWYRDNPAGLRNLLDCFQRPRSSRLARTPYPSVALRRMDERPRQCQLNRLSSSRPCDARTVWGASQTRRGQTAKIADRFRVSGAAERRGYDNSAEDSRQDLLEELQVAGGTLFG
jgi:hypothetical protein